MTRFRIYFQAIFFAILSIGVSAWPHNAGPLCSIQGQDFMAMVKSKHTGSLETSGNIPQDQGYTFQVRQISGTKHQLVLDGTSKLSAKTFKGLLLYSRDEHGAKIGSFSNYGEWLSPKMDCEGPDNSVLQHNSATIKYFPLTLTWEADRNITQVFFDAMVLVSMRVWTVASVDVTPLPVSHSWTRPTPSPLGNFAMYMTSPALFYVVWGLFLIFAGIGFGLDKFEQNVDKVGVQKWSSLVSY